MVAITLDQLVESGVKHAEHFLLKKREKMLPPFYTLITESGEMMILPVSYRNPDEKNAAVAVVRATAAISHAIKAMFISEAWLAKVPPGQREEDMPPPSESPDRIEVVNIWATDGEITKMRSLQMVRDKHGGKLIALIPMPEFSGGDGDGDDAAKHTTGPMVDGIIPPPHERKRYA